MLRHRLRLTGVLAGVALLGLALAPLQLAVRQLLPRRRAVLPKMFHRGVLRLLGLRCTVLGVPANRGVLYVSNHVSWADIPLLGSVLGAVFVAKAEMAEWPLLGWLARVDGVVFVERERPAQAGGQANAIAARLRSGLGVVLFPEGTTSNGETLLPFKTALFAAAGPEADDMIVQPITLAYTSRRGRPATLAERRAIAWGDDQPLAANAAAFLAAGPITAKLVFHPPVRRGDFADRKALARHCEQAIAAGLARLTEPQTD